MTPRGEQVVLDGEPCGRETLPFEALPGRVRDLETEHAPRWVLSDTARVYPQLVTAGVRIARSHDLRLARAVLDPGHASDGAWDAPAHETREPTLLDGLAPELTADDVLAEHRRQRAAVADSPAPGRLRLLLAAESAGALAATEMSHDGLPWDRAVHDQVLTDLLGPRPHPGTRPRVLEALAAQVRDRVSAPSLNPDSAPELLRALRSAGLEVDSTRKHELQRLDHPVIAPLLEYKRLARLLAANGWTWLDEWVRPLPGTAADGRAPGRFHPEYVVSGVVTGRWATSGGGALQLPKQIRRAVVADAGWRFVVADAAQLEPRVLAAMAGDEAMASAARGSDLYQGLVDQGVVDTRAHAKVAMLGALYGSTSGEAGRLMPRLMRAYPRATGVVEEAARDGERGTPVRTWLGRPSPAPPPAWHEAQRRAGQEDAEAGEVRRARQAARDWGRFTRNFVVQGTAAEWASCWLADLRGRLRSLGAGRTWSGPDGRIGPHLVFFLHDEVVVHTPADVADEVAEAVRAAAGTAGQLLFGTFPVEFPVEVSVVETYADAD